MRGEPRDKKVKAEGSEERGAESEESRERGEWGER